MINDLNSTLLGVDFPFPVFSTMVLSKNLFSTFVQHKGVASFGFKGELGPPVVPFTNFFDWEENPLLK